MMNLPYNMIQRNRPIATLLKWYADKGSGKVTDARKEILRRFDYLDWRVQKRIALAFLQGGKSDREWAYRKIYRLWDKCFQEPVRRLWEEHTKLEKQVFKKQELQKQNYIQCMQEKYIK